MRKGKGGIMSDRRLGRGVTSRELPRRSVALVLMGLWAIGFAFCTRWQWVSAVAVVIMPVERAASYAWAFAMWAVPGPPGGHPTAIGDTLRWVRITLLIVLIAGWIEYDRPNAKE